MEGSPLLPLSDGLHIERVTASVHELLVQIISSSPKACCPLCGVQAGRIHSRYTRQVADLPSVGRHVTLLLSVRKFFCPNPACPRTIFAEQFPELVPSYARLTTRLREALVALGLATSGEVASRLAPRLGMQVAPTTLLRRVRAVPVARAGKIRVLGVDEFAWKKGQTYGTILVDLELRRPVDLLPDRSEETLEAWLRTHPEIEMISRDRAGVYAVAARKGAPQAQQVVDRFHLLVNLRDGLKKLMERKQDYLPEVPDNTFNAIPHKARGQVKENFPPEAFQQVGQKKHFRKMSPKLRRRGSPPATVAETYSQVRRANRYRQYQAVRTLHQQGFSQRDIARRLKIGRQTVRRFLRVESLPERSQPTKKAPLLDPHKPYLLKRWHEGCWNGTQLYYEIKERGYKGSASYLRRFIADLRKKQQVVGNVAVHTLDDAEMTINEPAALPPKPHFTRRLSPTSASWLYICQQAKLDEKQRQDVEHIRQGHRDLDTAYQLSQAFVLMLAQRRGTDLDAWLVQAQHSGIAELNSFAQGIRRDYAAVRAAFSSKWSNGQVEGQVNRLKLMKRLMFGRAKFDVLRQRVLYHA
jgi:transposase